MHTENNFDSLRQELLVRITSPYYIGLFENNGKIYLNDTTCLTHFPVLNSTPYNNGLGITEELAKSIAWPFGGNYKFMLNDDLNNYYFDEHSLYLLKEHFKMVLKYTQYNETKVNVSILLNKLNKINEL